MFLDTRLGNTPRWFMGLPKDAYMRVPDEIRDCVVFVGRILQKGSIAERRLTGTAFIILAPTEDERVSCYYLVTARHVADGLMSGGEWFIRHNSTDGRFHELLPTKATRWYNHPDPTQASSVDAAVMPLDLPVLS